MTGALEPVIGLEVHAQLRTGHKLFCDCPNEFGAAPNAHTCPICSGYPGVLPVPNPEALWLGVRAALALGCEIQALTRFDRKHYFYPDLPKGYQISQWELPFARGGRVVLDDGRAVALERIHWEEDAGKSTHAAAQTLVDLNRCGVPLIEIVSRPELRTPADAHAYLDSLKRTLRYTGASDCDMEKGSLRCDVNVSLRPAGSTSLGSKVEVKNVSSFRMVERALAFEIERQGAVLASGGKVAQETRLWDDAAGETRTMRGKEEAMDYRYFPEPDIPPLWLAPEDVARVRAALPELPWVRRARYRDEAGLGDYDAAVLTAERDVADYFEATWRALRSTGSAPPRSTASHRTTAGDAKLAANWVQTDVLRAVAERGGTLAELPLPPATLAELIDLVRDGVLSHPAARRVFARIVATGESPGQAAEALELTQISSSAALEPVVRRVLARSGTAVADYRAGRTKALDAIKGMVMRETRGRANPAVVAEILRRLLREPDARNG